MCGWGGIYIKKKRYRGKVRVEPLTREDACRARSAVGVGLVCSAYPAGVKAEGKRGGKLSGSLPAAIPSRASPEPWWSRGLPAWGRVFGNPAADTNWRRRVPENFPSFPAPGKQRGCLGSPRRSRNLSQLVACTQGLACLSRRVCRCVCLYMCV